MIAKQSFSMKRCFLWQSKISTKLSFCLPFLIQDLASEFSHTVMHGHKIAKALPPAPKPSAGKLKFEKIMLDFVPLNKIKTLKIGKVINMYVSMTLLISILYICKIWILTSIFYSWLVTIIWFLKKLCWAIWNSQILFDIIISTLLNT